MTHAPLWTIDDEPIADDERCAGCSAVLTGPGWLCLTCLNDEHARDEAQAELFRTYLTDQYAEDGDVTLNLTPDAAFTDAEQLRQYRAEIAGLEPFEALHPQDDDDAAPRG
jgi:hypothetical protein